MSLTVPKNLLLKVAKRGKGRQIHRHCRKQHVGGKNHQKQNEAHEYQIRSATDLRTSQRTLSNI